MKTQLSLVAGLAGAVALPAAAQEGGLPIAAQMYTLRDMGSLEAQFRAVAEAGVGAVETVSDHGVSAGELNALLEETGIEVISSHVPIEALREDMAGVVEFQKAVGNDTITVPYLEEAARPEDAAGWEALGAELGGFAEDLAAQDMRLAYHNHDFEMVEMDGRTALEVMFEAAGPEVLAELDLAWVDRGGHDPAEFLRRLGERVFAVHAKDNAPEGELPEQRGFTEVGAGTLDWEGIVAAGEELGVEWYIIEHDQPADAAESVATSAAFLRETLPGRGGE